MSRYEDLVDLLQLAPVERPLSYPPKGTRPSPFAASWDRTVALLGRELRLHGAQATVMELDFRRQDLRQDGMPRAGRRARAAGLVLSFRATLVPDEPELRYEVTEFTQWQDNVRAVALGLEALRAVDRYGVTRRGEQYAGWKQLGSGSVGEGDPRRGRELIAKAGGSWRAAAQNAHPDLGGAPDDFRDVIAARDEAAVGYRT